MSEVAEKAAEVTAEVVEEAVDGVVDVVEVVRTNPAAVIVAGVVGLAAGVAGGYFIAKKRLESVYEERMEIEIAETRKFFANLNGKVDEDGAVLTPMDVMEQRHGAEAVEALRGYQGRAEAPVETEEELIALAKHEQGGPWDEDMDERQIRKIEEARLHSVSIDKEPGPHGGTIEVVEKEETRNVFADPTFDLEEEMKHRTEDRPYIITHDEFYAADLNYDTQQLTYYELDDTLVNERDTPIDDKDNIVGDEHLTRFGSGSKDKNIVHVRNDKLATDYEITRSTGSYLEEVLGMPDEPDTLRHSNRNAVQSRRREFRRGDG